jgi:amino acid adenylation domain-containing protein
MQTRPASGSAPAVHDVTPETSAADYFRGVVAQAPDMSALQSKRATYTYADIDRWSDAIASDVAACKAPPEHPVAIVTADNIALVPAALAVLKAGHFFVMIDATDPADRIALILRESGAALCLVDSVEQASPAMHGLALVPLRRFSPALSAVPPARPPHPFVYVVYTSGTTGKPKAVVTRHRGFVARSLHSATRFGRERGMHVMYTALPGFTRAATNLFNALLGGATLCAFDARNESLDALAEHITRNAITHLSLTPSLFRRLMAAFPPALDLSAVRTLRIGADVVTPADVAAFRKHFPPGSTLESGFASTEAGPVFHISIGHDTPIPGPLVPIGLPRAGVDVWLLDEEGNEVPVDTPGELVVRSEQVADGYWKDPEQTAQRFAVDPDRPGVRKFYTGDLAKRDAAGLYYFIGRKDARLKIHGRRIDPSEVEGALLATGEVRDAVVVGQRDEQGEVWLTAYVVVADGKSFDPRQIRTLLRESVPGWMVPARIHALDAIPMTRAGKRDRAALAARVDERPADEEASSDATERQLVEIWSRVLGTRVRVDDDFFDDLGGESIVAAHLVTEVKREMGRSLPLSLLLELNTVRKMADYLRARIDVDRTAIVVQPGGSLPPLFCVSGKGGSVIAFRKLAAHIGAEQPFYGLTHHGFDADAFPRTSAMLAALYAETIRAVQPEGPYYLAGYSVGGKIAYEIARQMTAAGDEVAFVGLIDTGNSGARSRGARGWSQAVKYLALLKQRPRKNGLRFARAIVSRIVRWMKGEPAPMRVVNDMNRLFLSLDRQKTLQPYAGHVTLFAARYGPAFTGAPDLGWKSLCGSLEVLTIPGEHHTVLHDDVDALAAAFVTTLAKARERAK